MREDALHALGSKRGHLDGAALFWTLPDHRDTRLLRLFVAIQIIYDYLDNVSERSARMGVRHDEQLFLALADALNPDCSPDHYYRGHPWSDDGGYLRALVDECRTACRLLPSFAIVRPFIARETSRLAVLALNHDVDPERRDAALEAWADDELPAQHGLRWYERTAAASQSIVTFALLAVAADRHATARDAAATYRAYFPWVAYTVTMLDSYVDQFEDAERDAHSYIAHYPDPELAVVRLCEGVERSAEHLLELENGERHTVLLGCMVAMYLSKDSARTPSMRQASDRIKRAGGSLTRLLMPILRTWRISKAQTSAT